MKDNLLKVEFFGEFSLVFNGESLGTGRSKNSKASVLLQYFLAHRGKGFSKEHLMELLYEEEETQNPENALKILIHRIRKQLLDSGLPAEEILQNIKGKYVWKRSFPCLVDMELFEDSVAGGRNETCSKEERREFYLEALRLYRGEFLGHWAGENWVIPIRVHYQELFDKAFKECIQLLKQDKDFELIYAISSQAALLYPTDEEILLEKIGSLHAMGKTKEAIHDYHVAQELIYGEFGVAPSSELLALYERMKSALHEVSGSAVEVNEYLADSEEEAGAFYVTLENFAESYRFITRGMERSGLSGFLMLCSIVNGQGRLLEDKEQLEEASSILKEASKNALRKGDLYTRYSNSQYLYLLIGINQENCTRVFQRVEHNFKSENKNKLFNLSYKAIPVSDTFQFFD